MRRWWITLAMLMVLAALAVPGRGEASRGAASHVPAGTPSITLNPGSGKPGQTIVVSGTGFNCHGGSAVAVVTMSGVTTPNAPIACNGTFTVSFRVPDISLGTYTVTAKGYAPGPGPAPTDTTIPTDTSTATPTSTPPPSPTATNTATATATSTPTPAPSPTPTPTPTSTPTATPTVTPTATPANSPTPTATNTSVPVIGVAPTSTPTGTPTPTPTATLVPTATFTPTPATPTIGPFVDHSCGPGGCTRSLTRDVAAQNAGGLAFDGDQASAPLTITAPSAPFTVQQQNTCTPPPTAGVPTTCTITETVTNNSGHPQRFDQVANQIAPGFTIAGPVSQKGQIGVSGRQVLWHGFTLAPQASTVATVRVTFTPSSTQVGKQVTLSIGIHANAVDLITGQRYTTGYGTLQTKVRVMALRLPQTGSGGASLGALPQTGGGAR